MIDRWSTWWAGGQLSSKRLILAGQHGRCRFRVDLFRSSSTRTWVKWLCTHRCTQRCSMLFPCVHATVYFMCKFACAYVCGHNYGFISAFKQACGILCSVRRPARDTAADFLLWFSSSSSSFRSLFLSPRMMTAGTAGSYSSSSLETFIACFCFCVSPPY